MDHCTSLMVMHVLMGLCWPQEAWYMMSQLQWAWLLASLVCLPCAATRCLSWHLWTICIVDHYLLSSWVWCGLRKIFVWFILLPHMWLASPSLQILHNPKYFMEILVHMTWMSCPHSLCYSGLSWILMASSVLYSLVQRSLIWNGWQHCSKFKNRRYGFVWHGLPTTTICMQGSHWMRQYWTLTLTTVPSLDSVMLLCKTMSSMLQLHIWFVNIQGDLKQVKCECEGCETACTCALHFRSWRLWLLKCSSHTSSHSLNDWLTSLRKTLFG